MLVKGVVLVVAAKPATTQLLLACVARLMEAVADVRVSVPAPPTPRWYFEYFAAAQETIELPCVAVTVVEAPEAVVAVQISIRAFVPLTAA